MNQQLRILVAGCGSAGSRHARNLAALGTENILLFDVDAERSQQLASEIGAVACSSVESALESGCDAVVVATPPTDHLATANLAINANAHVLIEKPLSSSLGGVEELLVMAEEANRIVMVAYNLRFLPALMQIKGMVESDVLGRILTVHAEFGQYLPTWRPASDYRNNYITASGPGGGIILEESHEFDYVMWLAGEVETVHAVAGKLSDLEMKAEDTAVVTMRHRNGAISTISIDCTQHGYRRGVRVVGTEATLTWDFLTGIEVVKRGGEKVFEPSVSDLKPTYEDEIQAFLNCLTGNAEPAVSGRDALQVLKVTLAARESARHPREITL